MFIQPKRRTHQNGYAGVSSVALLAGLSAYAATYAAASSALIGAFRNASEIVTSTGRLLTEFPAIASNITKLGETAQSASPLIVFGCAAICLTSFKPTRRALNKIAINAGILALTLPEAVSGVVKKSSVAPKRKQRNLTLAAIDSAPLG